MTASGWIAGKPADYDRAYAVDLPQLQSFIQATQQSLVEAFDLDDDGPARRKFLARLQGEITKRGTIDVLRHGLKHRAHHVDLFYGMPTPGNAKAAERFAANRFSVTRQLRYSLDETQLALDLGFFVNGLPIATFELKNRLTKQTVEDAVWQYKKDRDPRELLFQFGRCVAHFAVDDHEVRFCTHLKGKASWFLPFNLGYNDGAGNPPNPDGLKTDYLWKRILTPSDLTDILENYAQIVEQKDDKTGRKKRTQIWPRYHQLDVVRKLLAVSAQQGVGYRYLILHSAGNSLFPVPLFTYRNFPRREGLTVEQSLASLDRGVTADMGVQIPETLIDDCVRLCCSLCLLENDSSVIEPDVLSKDRDKFEASGDAKYVDRAHRRGKIG